ncbi:MAG TPA: glycosyltransferase family 4 protein [bacterium]|nr:glycosyltransferase family 4 protein [bacterium]
MKIAIIGPAYPYRGGIALHTNLLYENFSKGHNVDIINYKRLYPKLIFPGKTQYEQSKKFSHIPSLRMLDFLDPRSWTKTAQYIISKNYDLVIIQFWQPFFSLLLSTITRMIKYRDNNIKIISLCHNVAPHEGSPLDRVLTKFFFNAADGFLIQSRSVTSDLLKIVPRAPYEYNPHPLYNVFGKALESSRARRKLDIKTDEPLVLYFGYIRNYKGLEYLIQAYPQIHSKIGGKLLIIGEFYHNKQNYLDLIQESGVAEDIVVQDQYVPDDQVNLYFSAADILVLPYISATQSGITQIALAYNLPCVVTNVGGLPEVVHDRKTGFVVEPKDSKAISKAVIEYFTSCDKHKIAKNISRERQKYSWQRMKNTLVKLYRKIN